MKKSLQFSLVDIISFGGAAFVVLALFVVFSSRDNSEAMPSSYSQTSLEKWRDINSSNGIRALNQYRMQTERDLDLHLLKANSREAQQLFSNFLMKLDQLKNESTNSEFSKIIYETEYEFRKKYSQAF